MFGRSSTTVWVFVFTGVLAELLKVELEETRLLRRVTYMHRTLGYQVAAEHRKPNIAYTRRVPKLDAKSFHFLEGTRPGFTDRVQVIHIARDSTKKILAKEKNNHCATIPENGTQRSDSCAEHSIMSVG